MEAAEEDELQPSSREAGGEDEDAEEEAAKDVDDAVSDVVRDGAGEEEGAAAGEPWERLVCWNNIRVGRTYEYIDAGLCQFVSRQFMEGMLAKRIHLLGQRGCNSRDGESNLSNI